LHPPEDGAECEDDPDWCEGDSPPDGSDKSDRSTDAACIGGIRRRSAREGSIVMSYRALLFLVPTAAFGQLAMADGQVRLADATGKYQSPGSGGAFVMNVLNGYGGETGGLGLAAPCFYTFCVERTSYMSFGVTYYGELATSSSTGTSTTPLSPITAKLYSEFRSGGNFGGVGSFAAGYTSPTQSDAIQDAIWYAQGQLGAISGDALALYNWASANNNGSITGVRVLRLWSSFVNGVYSGNAQDQLTLFQDPLIMIPLPPASYAGLGTLGCLLHSHIRRRRRNDAE
jgi:hypothetical protein